MRRNFEISIKTHIDEMMCEAKKERALALIRRAQREAHQSIQAKPLSHQSVVQDVDLGECSVAPFLWYSHL